MKLNIVCYLGLALTGISFSATVVKAQPGYVTERSLEARIAQGQNVVRGTITNLTRTVIVPPGGFVTNVANWLEGDVRYGTVVPDGRVNYLITVTVAEVLKGPQCKTAELFVQTDAYDKEFDQWADQHTSFLCFIGKTTGSFPKDNHSQSEMPYWNAIRLGKPVAAEATRNGMVTKPPVYAMDFTALSEPEEILARARRFAKSPYGRSVQFYTFARIPNGPLWTSLVVPVTPPLEKTARQMIESGNRAEGIMALRYFKSAKNVRLLKPLLNDPTFSIWQTQVWNAKQVYGVRQAAYEVLQEWGVNVPKPVMEVKLPWKYDPSVRQKIEVQLPTKVWIHRTTNTFEMSSGGEELESTNVLVGSNMITGVKFEWFVYPEGEPRPANASRLDLNYWATSISRVQYFKRARDGFPVEGRKYKVEMDFTLFETDNPPPHSDKIPLNVWRPQGGKNHRVLLQQTLRQTSD